ncbi:hypothetical protein KKC88_03995 [Patescibacteria group bacterium]|nr:hypothetical protein [Patescibacteria group bacterium]MBU1672976.1 hypothetical protein [Patescibacteria group bacterium]MBU1962989.1 hypothetical protein [Patescibacteria group bacterium]
MKKPIILVVFLFAATLVFSGCFLTDWATKKASETVTEAISEQATNGDVDVDFDEGTFTVETEEGTVSIGQTEIPEEFPSNVPVYSGATVVWTSSSTADQAYWVDLESTDDFDTVETYYNEQLESNGWEVTDTTTYTADGQSTTIIYAQDGTNDLVVTVSSSDGKVMISLNAMAEQE